MMTDTSLSKDRVQAVVEARLKNLLDIDEARLEVVEVEEALGRVLVRFTGRYAGCPGREIVFRYVVEPILKDALEGVCVVDWVR